MCMRIINIIENTAGKNDCIPEHGLCFYVETKKHKILVDTGASGLLVENADQLGIDLEWHIEHKMKYNELRPYKHGGKKY